MKRKDVPMFAFHKPKIYRSIQGCCICRAKSSSSRFTDSRRYQGDFTKCFLTTDERTGEICNACVLLVKRWKKLPAGSTRNWHHVVDARAGPGTKSMNKIKNKAAGVTKNDCFKEERFKKKHKHKRVIKRQLMVTRKTNQSMRSGVATSHSPSTFSDDIGDECVSEEGFSCVTSSEVSEDEASSSRSQNSRSQTSGSRRKKSPNPVQYSSFIDLAYWKKEVVCCGTIFRGRNGEVMIDSSLMHPCRNKAAAALRVAASDAGCESFAGVQCKTEPQGGSALGLGLAATHPPVPFEVDPVDQVVALSPMSAHTPALDDEPQTQHYNNKAKVKLRPRISILPMEV